MPKISAVIPDDLGAALKERARAEDRSVGAVVRRALTEHVARPVIPAAESRPGAAAESGHRRDTGGRR
jgi:predicted transcriptional regulator